MALIEVAKTKNREKNGSAEGARGEKKTLMDELNVFVADAAGDKNAENKDLKKALKALIDDAEGDVKRVRENIETWFDDAMERVGGWYKRQTQIFLLVLGFVMAVGLNVDSIRVAEALWQDPKLRAVVAEEADRFVTKNPDATPDEQLEELQNTLGKLQLPIGWVNGPPNYCPKEGACDEKGGKWILTIVGWALTALAISLGASFWFNTLSKLLKLRATGAAPERKTKPAT